MAKRDEEGRLISDPDAEPWDSATDDPMGEVPMPKEKLPPKKDPKQSKLKLTSEERAFQTGWSVVKNEPTTSRAEEDEDFPCPICGATNSLFPVDDPDEEGVFECEVCRQLMGGGY